MPNTVGGTQPTGNATSGATATALQHLEHLVFGELEPGQELPSEPDLARRLGVSRLTVREATKSLQARGLVEVRHGRRPVVAHLGAGPIGDFFTAVVRRDPRRLLDLLEVRRALEVHIAGLAATQASRAAVTAIEMALSAMRGATDDLEAFHGADIGFHESIAAASGNQMLSFLVEAMHEPLHASRMRSLRGHLARGYDLEELIGQHAKILDRIKARDSDGASTAMRVHLEQTARDLKAALALPGSLLGDPSEAVPDRRHEEAQ